MSCSSKKVSFAEESVEMDPELAKQLFVEGATLIFLDVPVETEFGIDLKSWETGEKFKGVKMIPPGIHFIFYSARNSHGDVAPRRGFIHHFKKSEILGIKWDSSLEDISYDNLSSEEMQRFRDNLMYLDQFLGPYPFDVWDKWKRLTMHLNENLVNKLMPACGRISSAAELVPDSRDLKGRSKRRWSRPRTEEEKQEDLLPQLKPKEGTELRFTEPPEESYPAGSTPAEITKHNLDTSYAFERMISQHDEPLNFVGEIQFAFICFLVGLNYEAFEHWKSMIQLVCRCETAIFKRPAVFSEFVSTVEAQLDEVPEDFLVDVVTSNNVIYCSLRDLFTTLQLTDLEIEGRLRCKISRLKEKLTTKFEWDFDNLDEECEEDAPVIVYTE
nr:PREDICTED: protein AAR2 homolog [Bemisia tabaci]